MSQSDGSDIFDEESICQPGNENTGRWTSDEHRLFLRGLEIHGKGWKQIATLIQTRTVVQIRTHAQKYFQKLSKAQACGHETLDPATLMSTMDAGKMRPASVIVPRSLRSGTNISPSSGVMDAEERLRSLRKRHNRGKRSRHPDSEDEYGDDSATIYSNTSPRSINVGYDNEHSDALSYGNSRDNGQEPRQQQHDVDDMRLRMTSVMRTQHNSAGFGVGSIWGQGDASSVDQIDEEAAAASVSDYLDGSTDDDFDIDAEYAQTAERGSLPRRVPVSAFDSPPVPCYAHSTVLASSNGSHNHKQKHVRGRQRSAAPKTTRNRYRSSPGKNLKGGTRGHSVVQEGGAVDARAVAWAAAAAAAAANSSCGIGCSTPSKKLGRGGDPSRRIPEVAQRGGAAANTTRSVKKHDLSISGAIKDNVAQANRISPTSVGDINYMSFPAQQHYQQQQQRLQQQRQCNVDAGDLRTTSNGANGCVCGDHLTSPSGHLPYQLTPSWCTKPRDNWATMAGFDIACDADDAGPFRWFIDERSVSAPGAFFQSPAEAWNASDTTDVSTSVGVSSDGEGGDGDNTQVESYSVNHSTAISDTSADNSTTNAPTELKKRKCVETEMVLPAPSMRYASPTPSDHGIGGREDTALTTRPPTASDAQLAHEVNRHVAGDAPDGLDITSGLWIDHPQGSPSSMSTLGMGGHSVPGGMLSLPSLDDDEVLAFLACDEQRPFAPVNNNTSSAVI